MASTPQSNFRNSTDVAFEDLTYEVNVPNQKEKKQILRGVSGEFRSGQLSVIMGPSGAGKSTLLNVLTGYMNNGVEGTIRIGNRTGRKANQKLCSYILQDDNLFPWFTVLESMTLAARLKIGNKSHTYRQFMINTVLDNLNLSHTRNTKCADLSGGQKKRLSVAFELLDNPPVLFLDEPTSGLDSSSSKHLIKLLTKLAREGHTIVCTIHQPSASEYDLFDYVYVMAEGFCVYQGASINTIPYLNSVGLHCPQYHSAADYIIEVAHGDYGNFNSQLAKVATDNRWRQSQSCIITERNYTDHKFAMSNNNNNHEKYDINDPTAKLTSGNGGGAVANSDSTSSSGASDYSGNEELRNRPSEWTRLGILIGRCSLQMYRDWTVSHLMLTCHVFIGIILGLFYGNSGINAMKSYNNVGLLLIGVIYLWYTAMMPSVLKYPSEIQILKKETFNRWYNLKTYFMATIITATPTHVMFSLVYSTITYFMTEQPPELERFLKFVLVYMLTAVMADAFGTFLGTLITPVTGTFVGVLATAYMFMFSGFLVLFNHMPIVMQYVSRLSFKRYSMEGLVLALYDDNRDNMICPDEEMYCHYRSPKFLIQEMGMAPNNYYYDVMMMVLMVVGMRWATYFTLKRKLSNMLD